MSGTHAKQECEWNACNFAARTHILMLHQRHIQTVYHTRAARLTWNNCNRVRNAAKRGSVLRYVVVVSSVRCCSSCVGFDDLQGERTEAEPNN